MPSNGLGFSGGAPIEREGCRVDSSFQKSGDLAGAKRRPLQARVRRHAVSLYKLWWHTAFRSASLRNSCRSVNTVAPPAPCNHTSPDVANSPTRSVRHNPHADDYAHAVHIRCLASRLQSGTPCKDNWLVVHTRCIVLRACYSAPSALSVARSTAPLHADRSP